ncbi:hypothetical protein FB381_2800 [Nocardioides albertanoniae]|uniref:Heavy-metal-associated domain-containing protein n=1 Tax=Nocardioides albertanoniae TaxID=1175486 RepID=A0A543A8R5_9ACTN|nr:hypothetical protein [Nocardioides albertanoniae]TQL68900.1 hypothetical protein FB381_2800 [Nocardioides albertanoniae]
MKTSLKLGGFIAALAAILAASFGVGNAIGPIGQAAQTTSHSGDDMKHDAGREEAGHESTGSGASGHAGHGGAAAKQPGGLMISEHGYTLDLDSTILPAGRTQVKFRVTGPDEQPVTDYEPTHDKELHFIAVRRDMSGFQHVHPTLATSGDEAGTWSTKLDLTPGAWRVFADFRATEHGETMTLGGDVSVAGAYEPEPLPPVSQTAEVDGYTVTLKGQLVPGESSELTLTVSRDGQPVTDLQPYLAAYGHLVALRSGDLAYLHVHPDGEPGDGTTKPGPDITFFATAPSAGPYRLYLDFQHDGVVRTAEFTAQAGEPVPAPREGSSTAPAAQPSGSGSGDQGEHSH